VIKFTEILTRREELILILPESSFESYEIIRKTIGWKDKFNKLVYCTVDSLISFYKKNILFENVDFITTVTAFERNKIYLRCCENRLNTIEPDGFIVCGKAGNSNLQLNSDDILDNFAELSNLTIKKAEFNILENYEIQKNDNIVLDLCQLKNLIKIRKIASSFSSDFSAKIFVTERAKFIGMAKQTDLLKLSDIDRVIQTAFDSETIISDNLEFCRFLYNIGVEGVFFLGDSKEEIPEYKVT